MSYTFVVHVYDRRGGQHSHIWGHFRTGQSSPLLHLAALARALSASRLRTVFPAVSGAAPVPRRRRWEAHCALRYLRRPSCGTLCSPYVRATDAHAKTPGTHVGNRGSRRVVGRFARVVGPSSGPALPDPPPPDAKAGSWRGPGCPSPWPAPLPHHRPASGTSPRSDRGLPPPRACRAWPRLRRGRP